MAAVAVATLLLCFWGSTAFSPQIHVTKDIFAAETLAPLQRAVLAHRNFQQQQGARGIDFNWFPRGDPAPLKLLFHFHNATTRTHTTELAGKGC